MFTVKQDDHNSLDVVLFGNPEQPNPPEPAAVVVPSSKKTQIRNKTKVDREANKKRETTKKSESNHSLKNTGHWTYDENKKYHWFLELYSKHFLNKHLRRTDKIFKTMENFLGSREAQQCRSHHQKMQKKYKNFRSILLYLRSHHYGTEDHTAVADDLNMSRIEIADSLVEADYLRRQNDIQSEAIEECVRQEYPDNEQNKAIGDLFDDRYEHDMDFNDLLQ